MSLNVRDRTIDFRNRVDRFRQEIRAARASMPDARPAAPIGSVSISEASMDPGNFPLLNSDSNAARVQARSKFTQGAMAINSALINVTERMERLTMRT